MHSDWLQSGGQIPSLPSVRSPPVNSSSEWLKSYEDYCVPKLWAHGNRGSRAFWGPCVAKKVMHRQYSDFPERHALPLSRLHAPRQLVSSRRADWEVCFSANFHAPMQLYISLCNVTVTMNQQTGIRVPEAVSDEESKNDLQNTWKLLVRLKKAIRCPFIPDFPLLPTTW